ncbi:recombination regulator RecX [[Enterobacter] lignolyticus]|uniref:Regulatory protein RecX n=1 Tax=Enterobacter lignolyticus (strain SCF1) TaxID=701347 RepID=E3G6H8_ENTLS|nr:recombination regulator RecX [[Enterobacter] lignolyticus]ADO47301.1 regulatory protein RecX [[Enterobacter] lignolyticus SCF1]
MTDSSSPRRSAYARLLDRAIRILAMRDHSEKELRRKLAAPVMGKNGPEAMEATPEDIDSVIQWCFESRYLDDARFTRLFIASRSRKGYGPARIRQELNQKGIARQEIEQAMYECETDWQALAREQAERKFGTPLPTVFAQKVKVQRFLLNRGYLMEDIQALFTSRFV